MKDNYADYGNYGALSALRALMFVALLLTSNGVNDRIRVSVNVSVIVIGFPLSPIRRSSQSGVSHTTPTGLSHTTTTGVTQTTFTPMKWFFCNLVEEPCSSTSLFFSRLMPALPYMVLFTAFSLLTNSSVIPLVMLSLMVFLTAW